MKREKNKTLIFVVVFVFVLLSFSFVSANIFSDLWGKFTGKVIQAQDPDIVDGPTHPTYQGQALCKTSETAQAYCETQGYNSGTEGAAYSGGKCAEYKNGQWLLYQSNTMMDVECTNVCSKPICSKGEKAVSTGKSDSYGCGIYNCEILNPVCIEECALPPKGCSYEAASCTSCGKLVCEENKTIESNCSGIPTPCFKFHDGSSCALQKSCTWGPIPQDSITANTVAGDSFNACSGNVKSCESFSKKNSCEIQNGCDWKDEEVIIKKNKKNLNLYSEKEVFLISDKDWHDILPLVPVTTWTQQEGDSSDCQRGYGTPENVCVYPTLIWHEEEEVISIKIKEEDFSFESNNRDYFNITPIMEINNFNSGEELNLTLKVRNTHSEPHKLDYLFLRNYPLGFFISDEAREINDEKIFNPGEEREYSYRLIYEGQKKSFDVDSSIYFIQQFNTEKVKIIGETPQELDNLLVAEKDFGAGIIKESLERINPEDYFSYWSSYKEVVYVEDNYELALMASTYASLINAPLIIQGHSKIDLINRTVICVGDVNRNCDEQYNLEELQKKYVEKTNTDKIILVNPDDLDIKISEQFQPDKSGKPIYEIYSKTSLASPILASAKHEVIISTRETDYFSVDKFIEETIDELFDSTYDVEYLTILAMPDAITMTKENSDFPNWFNGPLREEVDNYFYGNFDKDFFQEVGVGRIFSISSSDISAYISRVLFYDKAIHKKDALIMQSDFHNMKVSGKFFESYLKKNDFEVSSYFKDELLDLYYNSFTEINEKAKDASILIYLDHAWTDGWGPISTRSLKKNSIWLNSPLIFSEGCGTCAWDRAYLKSELFCSVLLRRGAIGYYGATTDVSAINWDPAMDFFNELIIGNKKESLGKIAKEARNKAAAYVYGSGLTTAYSPHDSWNTLFGDPTFKINLPFKSETETSVTTEVKFIDSNSLNVIVNMPEQKKGVVISEECSSPSYIKPFPYGENDSEIEVFPCRNEYNFFEYPLGNQITRYYKYTKSVYNYSNNFSEFVGSNTFEKNYFVFKFNIPEDKIPLNISKVSFIKEGKIKEFDSLPIFSSNDYKFIDDFINYSVDIGKNKKEVWLYMRESIEDYGENNKNFFNQQSVGPYDYEIKFEVENV